MAIWVTKNRVRSVGRHVICLRIIMIKVEHPLRGSLMARVFTRIAVVLLAITATGTSALTQDSRSDLFSQQPGRYQIVVNPQVRADTFLVDTATGRVWQRTTFPFLNGDPDAWNIMPRLDGVDDRIAFIERFGRKLEPAAPPKPAISMVPTPAGPPLKLQYGDR
jgi:hypothetical protein